MKTVKKCTQRVPCLASALLVLMPMCLSAQVPADTPPAVRYVILPAPTPPRAKDRARYWTPTPEDVKPVEAGLSAYLRSQDLPFTAPTADALMTGYYRQYRGGTQKIKGKDTRVIYLHGLSEKVFKGLDWQHHAEEGISDTGFWTYDVNYNPATHKFLFFDFGSFA